MLLPRFSRFVALRFLSALGMMFFLVLPLSQLLMAQDKIDHRKLTHYLNDEGEAVPIRSIDAGGPDSSAIWVDEVHKMQSVWC